MTQVNINMAKKNEKNKNHFRFLRLHVSLEVLLKLSFNLIMH